MKVYLVECSAGTWSSYRKWVGGVYDTFTSAMDEVIRLDNLAKEVQDKAPKGGDETDGEYFEYLIANEDEMEWNGAKVLELEVGQRYGRFDLKSKL